MSKDVIDEILHEMDLDFAVEASKSQNGIPDPAAALGMAIGMGYTSLEDSVRLAINLGLAERDQNTHY